MKYIIKNCPAIVRRGKEYYGCKEFRSFECKENLNCLVKQIVEKCKEAQLPVRQWADKDSVWEEYSPKSELAKEILDLLDIEECEDER